MSRSGSAHPHDPLMTESTTPPNSARSHITISLNTTDSHFTPPEITPEVRAKMEAVMTTLSTMDSGLNSFICYLVFCVLSSSTNHRFKPGSYSSKF